jgi:hypothetical protein
MSDQSSVVDQLESQSTEQLRIRTLDALKHSGVQDPEEREAWSPRGHEGRAISGGSPRPNLEQGGRGLT